MLSADEITIIRQNAHDYVTIPTPGVFGIETKILKVDKKNNRVVNMVRFAPGGIAPPHYHHCTAVAYTVSGHWQYDEGSFEVGDVAYESIGNAHTPSSENGTEMLIVLDSKDGRMLDNYYPDGTVLRVTIDAYENLCGKTQAEIDAMSEEELMVGMIVNPDDAIPFEKLGIEWPQNYLAALAN